MIQFIQLHYLQVMSFINYTNIVVFHYCYVKKRTYLSLRSWETLNWFYNLRCQYCDLKIDVLFTMNTVNVKGEVLVVY